MPSAQVTQSAQVTEISSAEVTARPVRCRCFLLTQINAPVKQDTSPLLRSSGLFATSAAIPQVSERARLALNIANFYKDPPTDPPTDRRADRRGSGRRRPGSGWKENNAGREAGRKRRWRLVLWDSRTTRTPSVLGHGPGPGRLPSKKGTT